MTMASDRHQSDASNEASDEPSSDRRSTSTPDGTDSIYQILVEHSLAGATVIQDGQYAYVNPAVAEMLGYSREELLAVGPMDLVFKEDLAMVERNVRRRESGETEALRYSFRARRKDGQIVHLQIHGASAEFQGRRAAIGAVLDITEQKRLERALQESEAEMRLKYDLAPDMFASMDSQTGTIIECNETLAKAIGAPKADIVGHPATELYHPECQSTARQAFRMFSELGRISDIELQLRRRSGSKLDVSLSASAMKDEGGRIVKAILVMRDMTERRQAELELARARDEALSAARTKSTFLATMSHEIRTPMNAIIGMTDLLLDTPLSDTQRDFAETVRTAGEALLGIINDVLDYSKIEAGKFAIETIDFDVRSTIEEVVNMLAERAHQKDLELTALVDPSVPVTVAGDPARLRQVLLNLGGNAIKFTRTGEVIVRAAVETETDDIAVVRFSVEDTGIGIALDDQSTLFRPFSQVDSSTTRKFGGTGLGLAISKQLVELMGGRIGVDSLEDAGSTFWFTLMLKKRPTPAALSTIDRSVLRGLRVLVLDDNLTNRTLLRQQLAPHELRVDLVDNGPEALTRLRTAQIEGAPYALVLSDLVMPGMDGFEFARQVKADSSISGCRLVLLTSTSQRGQAAEAEQAGFSGFLVKPVREAQLLACVQSVLAPESTVTHARPLVTGRQLSEAAAQERTRVLLAEDNLVNQKVAVLMLEGLGCRVDVVGDGREAVAALARATYDIVFMDCQMPDLDGFGATAEIRRAERPDERVPIVAMTANAMEGDRDKCLTAGMDDYVAKPVKREQLEQVLRRWAPRPEPERRSA
jgi:PAS domain S-box-containing protein